MAATEARRLPQSPTCLIAISCSGPVPAAELAALREQGAGIFELRLDLGELRTAEEAADAAASFADYPLIVTCRSEREGGRPRTEEERVAMLRACLPHAQAVDIEMSSPKLLAAIKPHCDDDGPDLIISGHYFEHIPGLEQLLGCADAAAGVGADIIKVAAVTRNAADTSVLEQLLQAQLDQGRRMAVMGMGEDEEAARSRAVLAKAGSCFVFASHGPHASAPGQPSLAWLAEQLA